MNKYDYIIAGTGAAGLSLAIRLVRSKPLRGKKILLVDKVEKNKNDRTWCFWENGRGVFEDIVYARWNQLWFHGQAFSRLYHIAPYEYKLIRGIDFYQYCFNMLLESESVSIHRGEVQRLVSDGHDTYIEVDGSKIGADYIFSSIAPEPVNSRPGIYHLLQHFKGWVIQAPANSFHADQATLMDFRVDQAHGATFVYCMPFSDSQALVEYTVFSPSLLGKEEYDTALRHYCAEHLALKTYLVKHEEFGVIPMTNYPFQSHENRIVYIGTAGGRTRPSSGYTFQFIQKHSNFIVSQLEAGLTPTSKDLRDRHGWYDSVLLNILYNRKLTGQAVFSALFRNNSMQQVFKFLDKETSLIDEIRIIAGLPTIPFAKAGWQEWAKKRG